MEELKKNLLKIENKLITTSKDYSQKVVKRKCPDINILRESVKYRNGSIGYHLDQMIDYKKRLFDLLDQKHGYEKAMELSLKPSRKLNYLFDDLIFNIMSFYDYYSVFIIYLFYGDEIRNKAEGYDSLSITNLEFTHLTSIICKINWTEFVKLIRENEKSDLKYNSKIIQSSSASENIIQNDDEFIYYLSKLRNDIIHNKVSIVGQGSSYNPKDGASFSFSTPAKFREFFPEVNTTYEDGLKFIITSFSTGILDISNALLKDIDQNKN